MREHVIPITTQPRSETYRSETYKINEQTWVSLVGADVAGRGAEGLELGDAEPLVDGGEVPVLVDDDLVVGAAEEAEGLVPRPLRLPRGGLLLGEPGDVLACGKSCWLLSNRKHSTFKFCQHFCRNESQKGSQSIDVWVTLYLSWHPTG